MNKHIHLFLELGKVRISLLATITMVTGYILAFGGVSLALAALTLGVFLIACGASALNHIQERDVDALMHRTSGRPLPSQRAHLSYAWGIAVGSILVGSSVILISSNVTAMLLGLLAIAWYNAVYTPLKRISAFAAVAGGVVGAIPPVIGWVAGGGDVFSPAILAVAFFFFLWQVPHFWLLLLFSCGKDYERAGLPSITRIFTLDQIARITFMWIMATAVTSLVILLYGLVANGWIAVGLLTASAWLVWRSLGILRPASKMPMFRLAFRNINIYILWVISLLSASGVIG